jgi:multidrug efflux pump subunit AcrB
VVDDAIVVIENTHRIFANGKMPIVDAAKKAAGEVFLPVFSGTMTTLAPFVPLAFWQGIIGKFMYFLPVTLIITLLASLLVAYIINPVFAVQFMKPHHADADKAGKKRTFRTVSIIALAIAILAYASAAGSGFFGSTGFGVGNFVVLMYGIFALHHFWLERVIRNFQERSWPNFQHKFERLLTWCLKGSRPVWLLLLTVGLFFFSIVLTAIRKPNVVFFPVSEPNFVYVYLNVPVGSTPAYTDSITKIVEQRVYNTLGNNNPIVESVISNVAVGANDPQSGDRTVASHRSKVTIAFVEFSKRNGESTSAYLEKIRKSLKGIAGTEISVEQERAGPPTGKPINIEIRGDAFDELVRTASGLKRFIEDKKIAGIEELKSDFVSSKPEIVVNIDRERANRQGISTGQIGMALRNSIYGAEASKFRDNNDDYPIQVRIKSDQRNDVNALMNMKIGYRDMNMGGMFRQVPLSAVADVSYTNTFGGINRINQKRVIVLGSNLLSGYSPSEVIPQINAAVKEFSVPAGIEVALTGEQEQQAETQSFLGTAMGISLAIILLILVTQFNSISKPILILSEIIFSIIGVLLGLSIFDMSISIVMTGVGIVALAGIVVRNGILLVEFTELLRSHGVPLKDAIIEAGRTRMTPVLLTASATILGLIPLAVGLNIDFARLFTELNPHIFMGGDSVAFWGPLSWTMIFGLSFATFLTLILVPAMYLLNERMKQKVFGWFGKTYDPDAGTQPDALSKLDI